MCVISLIVFTDNVYERVTIFKPNGFSLHSINIILHNNKDYTWDYKTL